MESKRNRTDWRSISPVLHLNFYCRQQQTSIAQITVWQVWECYKQGHAKTILTRKSFKFPTFFWLFEMFWSSFTNFGDHCIPTRTIDRSNAHLLLQTFCKPRPHSWNNLKIESGLLEGLQPTLGAKPTETSPSSCVCNRFQFSWQLEIVFTWSINWSKLYYFLERSSKI